MYARSSPNDPYHLLQEDDEEKTLCGLSVAPIIIDRPSINTTALHLTSNRPVDSELCSDCAKFEPERMRIEK